MNRYHIKVYSTPEHKNAIVVLTNKLNTMDWAYSRHCTDNIKHRAIDMASVLMFIKRLKLNDADVFEYYFDNDIPVKMCYRVQYNAGIDLILVVSNTKCLVTIYMNTHDDKHYTLNRSQYARQ